MVRIYRQLQITAVSHLTCVCHSRDELASILDQYAASGFENILALGGAPPSEHAQLRLSERRVPLCRRVVRFIKNHGRSRFDIGIAGFPESHPVTPNSAFDTSATTG